MDGTTQLLESDRRFLVHPLHHPEEHKAPLLVESGRGRDAASRRRARGDRRAGRAVERQCRARARRAGRCRRRADAQDRLRLGLCRRHQRAGDPARREDRRPRLLQQLGGLLHDRRRRIERVAFKTARFYWKIKGKPDKTKIISRIHGYHGVTMAAMSATGMPAYHKMFGPLMPGFVQVQPPYPYRWQGNQETRPRRRRGGREGDPRARGRRPSRR